VAEVLERKLWLLAQSDRLSRWLDVSLASELRSQLAGSRYIQYRKLGTAVCMDGRGEHTAVFAIFGARDIENGMDPVGLYDRDDWW